MSNRTYACLACRKLQRKPAVRERVTCPACNADCLCVHWKLHVPAPKKRKKWDAFWKQYLLERRLIEVFQAGGGPPVLELPLLNQRFTRR